MTENSSLMINTPKKSSNQITNNNDKPFTEQNPLRKVNTSIASTEINSNKKNENIISFTPKKKSSSKIEAIKTFCRIRPIKGTNELFSISQKDDKILNINSANLEKLNVGNNLKLINSYKFSKVFGEFSTQEEIFEYTCKPLIDDLVLNQRSGLVFTYGMTNAGKTFTVIGTPDKPGILPQALKTLLEYDVKKKNNENNANFNFYCNFVEIYNEDVFDLLADDPTGKNKFFKNKLNVKENLNSVFFLQDVTFEKLDDLDSFNNILNKGISKKVHSSTNLNQNSSRSHTIFKIILLNNNKDISQIDFSTEELISLSVVDLAGSERQKRTDAKGKNLQEACKINQSLSTLGKCLEAMKHNSISNIKKMVPLRESKLTKIFAEYFQGDQNIIMITNINPRTEDFEETIRALNYSCIAKDIKPIKSIIPKLSAGNELKLQLKKEKKLNENITNNINIDNNNNNNNSEKTLIEGKTTNNLISNNENENKNNADLNKNEKLADSLTLNLNELFNSNSDVNEGDMKTEFTRPPEDNSSTKYEIAQLMQEIKKLREEVSEFKGDNNTELKKSEKLCEQHPQKSKNIALDRNKSNCLDNNINPFNNNSVNENSIKQSFANDLSNNNNNNNTFNCDESIVIQDNNCNTSNTGLVPVMNNPNVNNPFNMNNLNNMNNMLAPYGNYGYPYNNPFIPFYGGLNPYNSPFLPLPDPKTYNQPKNVFVGGGKGKKKNKKINDILNSAFNSMIPTGFRAGVNLIFINSKFGNLNPGPAIQEDNYDLSDSDDDDSNPRKRKVKGTPKKKKRKSSRNKQQKYNGKPKNSQKRSVRYPKINNRKYNRDIDKSDEENYVIEENDNESNFDDESSKSSNK